MSVLPAREAYRLWAPTYEAETAISFLEDRLVAQWGMRLTGLRLLDAGCGTGRRLRRSRAALAVGVDLTPEMLLAGDGGGALVAADVRALPLAAAAFDVVWCRLVVGHLPELTTAYAELARACRPGGLVLVTDFHPDAAAAGHRRTFRGADGEVHEVEHYVHALGDHLAAARTAGLELWSRRDGRVGPILRPFYARAQRLDAYRAHRGLPVVLALAYHRVG
ncbi:MAG TPA: class I SAM-dependent methyltransferase [Longimicrobiaceae bacterium]|nr:class I SAM-dependent methyltransferase [Longimicrobiaceae bacterium]